MRKFLGFFIKENKRFPLIFQTNFWYNSFDVKKFSRSSVLINKELTEVNFSIDQINDFLINNIENGKFIEFWKNNKAEETLKFTKIFEEINNFTKNILEEMTVNNSLEKNRIFSSLLIDLKKEEIFKLVFNRLLMIIHNYNQNLMEKSLNYEKKIKVLSMMINFLSILIYFPQSFTSKNLHFFSSTLKKFFKDESMQLDFHGNYKKAHSLLKENLLIFLNDNLEVYKLHRYNFLSHCSYNFGHLVFQFNEYLFDFDEKMRLSRILIAYLKENLIETGELIDFKIYSDDTNLELFNLCLKDKSHVIFENVKNLKDDILAHEKIHLSDFFILTFKQISEYFAYHLNEKKPIATTFDLLTCLEVLKINGIEINLKNLLFYMQKFCEVKENKEQNSSKKFLSKQINLKMTFIVDVLSITTSSLSKTNERTSQIVMFFEQSFQLFLDQMNNPLCDVKISKENIAKVFQIFLEARIFSLDLLSKVEEKLMTIIQELPFYNFFQILLFYTHSPNGVYPTTLKYHFLHYIKTNFHLFNFESLLSIGLAILQLGYNRKSGLYEVFMFIDHDVWGKLINKIMNYPQKNLTKQQIFKIYMFVKLVNFDPVLKNEVFEEMAENYKKEFLAFELRKISEIQYKFEKMLLSKKMTYIMEPPLIEGIFSVDFLIKYKKERVIVEINGPHHYFTVLWKENQGSFDNVLETFENKSEIFEKKGMALVESRYTSMKQDLLEKFGFVCLTISFLDTKNNDTKERLFEYFMDYLELRNKKKIKGSYFLK